MLSSRISFLKKLLILLFAEGVLTNLSQSLDGPFEVEEVIASTTSPFCKIVSTGTIFELILMPTHLLPTCEWTAYAKSMPVEPAGRLNTSPLGVNTNT